jgi:glycolate oxidase FAD binding subunit
MSLIAEKLVSLLGAAAVVDWQQLEPRLKAQIAQATLPEPVCVVYPATVEELAEVVACAQSNRWKLLPCGHGSKLHWGGLATDVQIIVSTAKLNRLIEHASGDLTVTAEAGLQFAELQSRLSAAQQFLPLDPAYPDLATLGGIVATADTGALRQRYGGVRDLLIGIEFIRSDGKLTKAGGRVVKNVAGYDLMKLLTGSYGTLGILTQLTFRIYPLPPTSETIVLTGASSALAQATASLLASGLTPTAVELITPTVMTALQLGEDMGLIVRFQSLDVSVTQQSTQVMQLAQFGLKAVSLSHSDEQLLWQQLPEQIYAATHPSGITCKIGVEPAKAVATLQYLPESARGIIHASSGLGLVQLSPAESIPTSIAQLTQLRQLCQTSGGFLTVLAAPIELKQRFDVWGYPGNALPVMQRLKTQFDPHQLLSPHRFVGTL